MFLMLQRYLRWCLVVLLGTCHVFALVLPQTNLVYDANLGAVDFPFWLQVGYLSPLSTGQSFQPPLTPVAPQWFMGAKHTINLDALTSVGLDSMKIHYKDVDYNVIRIVGNPVTDIVLLQVAQSVPDYVPIYKNQVKAGTPLTVYGRGSIGTTPIKTPNNVVLGWDTANLDGRLRQGQGVAKDTSTVRPFIEWDFTPTSCYVDFADSGGPVFVGPAIAGCIWSQNVADGYATECGGTPQFGKNLFNPSQAITWILDQNQKVVCFPFTGLPSSSVASSAFFYLDWIYGFISPPVLVDAGGATPGWTSWLADSLVTPTAIDTSAVLNPAPQSVYQTLNFILAKPNGALSYRVDYLLSTEHYHIRLHFSNFWQPGGSLNEDVYLNGVLARANFDPAQGAQNTASVLEFSGVSPDGNAITIEVRPHNGQGNAAISGLEISRDTGSELDNLILPSSGGNLENFSSELNATWAAANLTDGVGQGVGHSWSSTNNPGAPQNFTYSFKDHQIAMLDSLRIFNYGETGVTNGSRDIEFYASIDGLSWNLVTSTTLPQQEGGQVLDLGKNAARFVKLSIKNGYSTNYWELGEVEVHGTLQGNDVLLPSTGGKLVSWTSQLDNSTSAAANLADGIAGGLGHSWSSVLSPSVPQEFVYSFQNQQLAFLNWVVLYNYGGDSGLFYSKDVEFYTSLDGVVWTLFSAATLDQSVKPQAFNLNGTSARYLKVTVKSGYSAGHWDLGEIEAYGTISIANKPPTAAPASYATLEEVSIPITLTGSDPESAALSFTSVTLPRKGLLLGLPPNVIYVPKRNENGHDSFTFKVSDGITDSAPAVVNISITPVNDPPEIGPLANEIIFRNSGPQKIHFPIRPGPTNEIQGLTVTVTSDNPDIIPAPAFDYTSTNNFGTLTVNPVAGSSGIATIRIVAKDDGGTANGGIDIATNQFTITVIPALQDSSLLLPPNGGKLVSFTSQRDDVWSAARLTDGAIGFGHSWASTNGPVVPQEFVYSFGSTVQPALGWITISNYGEQDGALASSQMDVFTSTDATNWTKAVTNAMLQSDGQLAYALNGVIAGFLKVSVRNGYSTNAWELGEIGLYQTSDNDLKKGRIRIANFSSVTATDQTWDSGGAYTWKINSANGPSGADPGYDLLQVNGVLNITSTTNSPFTIHIVSLDLNELSGPVYDFNNQSNHLWTVAHTLGGISGFAPGKINLDFGSFSNNTGGGVFALQVSGNDLQLQFTPALVNGNAFTWSSGGGTSDWFTPANWSPAGVPSASDTVTIDSGTVNLGSDVTVANLTFTGGTLTGAGQLTVANLFNWTGGLLQRAGPTVVMTGAMLNITGSGNHDLPSSTLTNFGTVAWTGGPIRGGGTGTRILNFGLWDIQADNAINADYGGSGVVVSNSGIFRKSAGSGSATVSGSVAFNNNALLDVQSGSFVISGSGNSSGGIFNTGSGGNIYFNNDYTLNTGSSFTGNGTNLLTAGTLTLNGSYTSSNLKQIGGRFAGTNTLHGVLTWSGGDWVNSGSTTIADDGVLNISSPADHDLPGHSLTNLGTVIWTGGNLRGGGTGTLIQNLGLWNVQSDNSINDDYGGAGVTFNNVGTFRKSSGAGTTAILVGVAFNNSGLLDIQTGTFLLNGGGLSSGGTFNASAGTTIDFNANYSVNGGSIFTGSGSTVLSGGTLLLDGSYTSPNLTQNGGTLGGSNTIHGVFTWSGGNWLNNGFTTIAADGVLNITGQFDHDFPHHSLTNLGTVHWIAGNVRGGGTGTLIQNSGLWDAQSDNAINDDYGGQGVVFNNSGTFRKSAGNGVTSILTGVGFNNAGLLDIQTGTFLLSGGGTSPGGTFNAAAAATIDFNSDYSLGDGSSLTGAGTNLLTAGTLRLNGSYTSSNLFQTGGQFAGTNVLHGIFSWLAGDWNGGAFITISTNSTLNILTPVDHDISNSTLTNYGTVNWTGGRLRTGPSTRIDNFNLWNAQIDSVINGDFGGGALFANFGLFHKSLTTNSTAFLSGVHFSNSGAVVFDDGPLVFNDGGTFLNGSRLNGTSAGIFQGGTFMLDGAINCTNIQQTGGTLAGTNVLNGGFSFFSGTWNSLTTFTTNSTLNILSPADHDLANGSLTNYGTVIWSGGRIRGGGAQGSAFYNFGLWDNQVDSVFNSDLGGIGVVFNNFGTFRKSVGSSVAAMLTGVAFNNSGLLDVQTGTFLFSGGGNSSGGKFNAAAGATINFNGDFHLNDSSSLTGPGTNVLSGGTLALNGIYSSSNLRQTGGRLAGTNILNGTFTWLGGDWNGGGSITIATNSTLNISTASDHDIANSTLMNYGTVNWTGGRIRTGPTASIYNFNSWNAQIDSAVNADFGGGAGFINAGTFHKSVATNSTTFLSGVHFTNTGSVMFDDGALIFVDGGTFLNGSMLAGTSAAIFQGGTFMLDGAINCTNIQQTGGTLIGSNVLSGGFSFFAGTWNSFTTFTTNSTLHILSAADHDFANGSLTNYGTVIWSGGRIRGGGAQGSSFYNFGLWDNQVDSVFNNDLGGIGVVFNNSGTFRKSAGFGFAAMLTGVAFNNSGLLDVQTGTFLFNGGGNSSGGIFNAATGATIDFNGDFHLNDSSSLTGPGTNLLSGGTLALNGIYSSSNLRQTGGRLAGTNILNGTFTWLGGDWNGGGSITIATNSTLNISTASDHDIANSTLMNYGTVNWTGGRIRTGPNANIVNLNIWNAQIDSAVNADFGGGAGFINAGTFHKSLATNSTTFLSGVRFINTGSVIFDDGALVFVDGGTFLNGSMLNGTSAAMFHGGTFMLDGAINCTNIQQTGGTLAGTNVLSGGFSFFSGTWNSLTTFTTNSTLNILSPADHDFANGSLTNYGTVIWSGGRIRGGGAQGSSFYNFGLWDNQVDSVFNNDLGGIGVVFNNFGTLRKSAGSGVAAMLTGVVFNNSGLLDVQTGTFLFSGGGNSSGGIFNAATGATIDFNGDFHLNNSSSLAGPGTNVLSGGTLTLNGIYSSSNLRQTGGRLAGTNILNGTFTWLGGDWDGGGSITIATNSTLNILIAADHDIANSALTNYGTVNWTGGRIRTGPTASIYNFNIWNAQIDSVINADLGGGAAFVNAGTFHKSSTAGATTFQAGVRFSNSGAIISDDGTLIFIDGGAFSDGTVLAGTGSTLFQSGTFNVNGLINSTNLVQSGGTMVGSNVFNGVFNFSGGVWNTVTAMMTNSTLNIVSAQDHDFVNCVLTNYGNVVWTGGRVRGGGANGTLFYNFGQWNAQTDSEFNDDYGGTGVVFDNPGTFRKIQATGTTTVRSGVSFNNMGTLDIESGIVTIQGNYNPDPTSQTVIALAGTNPGTGYGQLRVNEFATLAGSLTLAQGSNFFPTNNAVFNLVLYPSQKGTFSSISGLHTTTADFTAAYTTVSLDVTAAVTISGYEADVSPRPNGRNNGTVSITSWVQIGRFAAGLDLINSASEFARADCAPRVSGTDLVRGNGIVGITDWVQAGRYAAGLDTITPVGGPTGPNIGPASLASGGIHALSIPARTARLIGTTLQASVTNTILVAMDLVGDENAAGFSLAFDPSALSVLSIAPGPDAADATFLPNLDQARAGRIGVALARSPGQVLGSGSKTLVRLLVVPLAKAASSTAISFADYPIRRETVDAGADPLETAYKAATFALVSTDNTSLDPSIALKIRKINSATFGLGLQGAAGLTYEIQSSTNLLTWNTINRATFTSGSSFQEVVITTSGAVTQFYRARQAP